MRRLRLPGLVVAFSGAFLIWLGLPAMASAAPVTLDFESGATVGQKVTNQYGPSGTPAGPTFEQGQEAGFKNLFCGAPTLDGTDLAHSGSNSLLLNACENGEFWPTATFFSLGYSTDSVEFWIADARPHIGQHHGDHHCLQRRGRDSRTGGNDPPAPGLDDIQGGGALLRFGRHRLRRGRGGAQRREHDDRDRSRPDVPATPTSRSTTSPTTRPPRRPNRASCSARTHPRQTSSPAEKHR